MASFKEPRGHVSSLRGTAINRHAVLFQSRHNLDNATSSRTLWVLVVVLVVVALLSAHKPVVENTSNTRRRLHVLVLDIEIFFCNVLEEIAGHGA